jgi:hypothetical protein
VAEHVRAALTGSSVLLALALLVVLVLVVPTAPGHQRRKVAVADQPDPELAPAGGRDAEGDPATLPTVSEEPGVVQEDPARLIR